jgi:uncharacterized oligopeptide transporter (OPT) family protein
MQDAPARVVYAITTLISAGIAATYLSWWVVVTVLMIGVVLIVKPEWSGDDLWPM